MLQQLCTCLWETFRVSEAFLVRMCLERERVWGGAWGCNVFCLFVCLHLQVGAITNTYRRTVQPHNSMVRVWSSLWVWAICVCRTSHIVVQLEHHQQVWLYFDLGYIVQCLGRVGGFLMTLGRCLPGSGAIASEGEERGLEGWDFVYLGCCQGFIPLPCMGMFVCVCVCLRCTGECLCWMFVWEIHIDLLPMIRVGMSLSCFRKKRSWF